MAPAEGLGRLCDERPIVGPPALAAACSPVTWGSDCAGIVRTGGIGMLCCLPLFVRGHALPVVVFDRRLLGVAACPRPLRLIIGVFVRSSISVGTGLFPLGVRAPVVGLTRLCYIAAVGLAVGELVAVPGVIVDERVVPRTGNLFGFLGGSALRLVR